MTDYIITYSKRRFYPLEPKEEDICVEDIAHALSMLCRANGHYESFYSVAAHSLNCYEEALARRETARICMACLLHDAQEAYLSDLTRPVKQHMPEYNMYEKRLQEAIFNKFLGSPLNEYEAKVVKAIDDAMLFYEFYEFMAEKLQEEAPYVAATPNFYRGTMRQVEQEYIAVQKIIDLQDASKQKNTIKWIH